MRHLSGESLNERVLGSSAMRRVKSSRRIIGVAPVLSNEYTVRKKCCFADWHFPPYNRKCIFFTASRRSASISLKITSRKIAYIGKIYLERKIEDCIGKLGHSRKLTQVRYFYKEIEFGVVIRYMYCVVLPTSQNVWAVRKICLRDKCPNQRRLKLVVVYPEKGCYRRHLRHCWKSMNYVRAR